MKLKKRLASGLAIVMFLALSSVVSASGPLTGANAFYTGGGFKNLSVVENLRYYVDPTANTTFGSDINDAISAYSSIPSVNFGFEEVDWIDEKPELMIYRSDNNPHLGVLPGIMIPCNYTSSGDCSQTSYNTRWDASVIFLSKTNMDADGYNATNKRKTVAHEFGHVYALEHQSPGVNSIMVGGKGTITSPTSLDINNLQWKY